MDSPLARAMMRRVPGDEISIESPGGPRTFLLLEVSYST
jgi:transcription elongation GreA/GreB family factor